MTIAGVPGAEALVQPLLVGIRGRADLGGPDLRLLQHLNGFPVIQIINGSEQMVFVELSLKPQRNY